jgi:hypothetical protein
MSIPSWCRVGAKVVCISKAGLDWDDGCPGPVVGEVCTITGLNLDHPPSVGVCLLEHTESDRDGDPGYDIKHFRPLVETITTDEVEQRLFRKKRLHQPVSARLTSA